MRVFDAIEVLQIPTVSKHEETNDGRRLTSERQVCPAVWILATWTNDTCHLDSHLWRSGPHRHAHSWQKGSRRLPPGIQIDWACPARIIQLIDLRITELFKCEKPVTTSTTSSWRTGIRGNSTGTSHCTQTSQAFSQRRYLQVDEGYKTMDTARIEQKVLRLLVRASRSSCCGYLRRGMRHQCIGNERPSLLVYCSNNLNSVNKVKDRSKSLTIVQIGRAACWKGCEAQRWLHKRALLLFIHKRVWW